MPENLVKMCASEHLYYKYYCMRIFSSYLYNTCNKICCYFSFLCNIFLQSIKSKAISSERKSLSMYVEFSKGYFMVNSYDFLDPMNKFIYLEANYPTGIKDVSEYVESFKPVNFDAKLKPQPEKDSWYYKNDGVDDGKISFKEKLKAFFKGGTYNVVKGLFCDKDGFSLKRTLGTAAIGAAIAFAGPAGVIAAGAVGLIAGAGKFAQAVQNAKTAVTDSQSRVAYEGIGEGTSLTVLSLFGGFKGFKAINKNFAFAKHHKTLKVKFSDKFVKWDASKYATRKA